MFSRSGSTSRMFNPAVISLASLISCMGKGPASAEETTTKSSPNQPMTRQEMIQRKRLTENEEEEDSYEEGELLHAEEVD